MRILLVGNYPYEGSVSMQIWARTLERELLERGFDVRLILPRPVFGKLKPSSTGMGKWLGYVDRYLIFPLSLRAAARKADVIHVCDHGSAMYCSMLDGKPVVVTCNDMHAVLGARGEVPDCPATLSGRVLQGWICRGLRRASRIACISTATFHDAQRVLSRSQGVCVILDALNHPFQPLPGEEVERRLAGVTGIEKRFLLHVGTNSARKNREGILRIFAQVAERADLQMVFVGEALNERLIGSARELGIYGRVVQVVRPQTPVLEALYNRALALIFPSRFEGFGWPPIEAQACGCPVVASDIPPIAEVLRDSAALHNVDDEAGMAASILKLADDPELRRQFQQLGLENIRSRFQTSRMMSEYISLYEEIACQG